MSNSVPLQEVAVLPGSGEPGHSRRFYFISALIVMAVTFVSSSIGILTRPEGMLAAFWFTNAVLLGLYVRCPCMMSVLSVITAFIGYVLADLIFGSDLLKSVLLTSANMAGVLVGYLLYMQLDEDDRRLKLSRSVLFMVVIVFLASLVAGLLGAVIAPVLFKQTWQSGLELWLCTEFTNFTAMLPVILTMPGNTPKEVVQFIKSGTFKIRLWLLIPAVSVVGCMALGNILGGPGAFAFPVPALIWCALTYKLFPTTLVALGFSVWTLMAISLGYLNLETDVQEHYSLLSIRLGVAMISLTPLTVGSIMTARLVLQKRLEYLANYDTLTNVLNRNGFYLQAGRVWEQMEASGKRVPISLLVLDLDHFKNINDEFGHVGGDIMIREFAQGLQKCVRKNDVIGRWGGEEFVVLLPECPRDNALNIARKMAADLEAREIPYEDGVMKCTTSIGVAVAANSSTHLDVLLKQADDAVYQAKSAGRNQVVMA